MAAEQLGTNETIAHLGDFFAAGGTRTIGALVFWSLSQVSIPRDMLRGELEQIGMGAGMPRDPKHAGTLTVALNQARVGKPNVILRKIAGGWAIVVERTGEDKRLGHVHAATVKADPQEAAVRRRRENHPERRAPELDWEVKAPAWALQVLMPFAREVEERFVVARQTLDTSDLSEILVNMMHGTSKDCLLEAVSLRQTSGGLYFVHGRKLDQLRALKEVVERLAPACELNVLTITGSADNLLAASKAARASFQHQLADLRREMGEFRAAVPFEKRTERSIQTRAAAYSALAAKVELFRDVLGQVTDELGSEIAGARAEVERLLDAP